MSNKFYENMIRNNIKIKTKDRFEELKDVKVEEKKERKNKRGYVLKFSMAVSLVFVVFLGYELFKPMINDNVTNNDNNTSLASLQTDVVNINKFTYYEENRIVPQVNKVLKIDYSFRNSIKGYTKEQIYKDIKLSNKFNIPKELVNENYSVLYNIDENKPEEYYLRFDNRNNESDYKVKELIINIAEGKLPLRDYSYNTNELKKSIINGVEMDIIYTEIGEDYNENHEPTNIYNVYFTRFMYNGYGYDIEAVRGFTEQEIINLITSIVMQ